MPEGVGFRSGRHGQCFKRGVVVPLGFGRRDVPYRLQQPAMVESSPPIEGGEPDSLERALRPAPMDHLSLEQADDGLGKGVVVAVADAAGGRLDAGLGQAWRL